jgi:hypothetical protein
MDSSQGTISPNRVRVTLVQRVKMRLIRILAICSLVFWWTLLPVDSASANGTISGTVNENGTLTLTPPQGYKIGGIQFASYGTPVNFQIGECHASNSTAKVEEAISNNSLSISASNTVFGDPCSGVGKRLSVILTIEPIVIQKKANERTRLNLSELPPLTSRTPTWIIVTPENVNSVWKDLKDKNTDVVLFALTDDGYEELALNIAELRNFINSQRQIIIKYKQYYEPTENKK